jgi:hypothetical protein
VPAHGAVFELHTSAHTLQAHTSHLGEAGYAANACGQASDRNDNSIVTIKVTNNIALSVLAGADWRCWVMQAMKPMRHTGRK